MDRDRFEQDLLAAEQLLKIAEGLLRAQEAEVRRMRESGLNPTRAESLLFAYRAGFELALERREAIRTFALHS
jgi:hypothetical protein